MIPQKKPNILDTIKKRGTFQVNPEEESFILDGEKGGLNEEQIIKGLTVRRQDLKTGVTAQTEQGLVLNDDPSLVEKDVIDPATGEVVQSDVQLDPFGGRSKQEVIMLAFQSGITKKESLKEIADTYDLVTGGEKTKEQIDEEKKQDNFSKAEQFISDNPDASREELKAAILQHTGLDNTGIDALLNKSNIKEAKNILTEDDAKTIATSMIKEKTGFFTDPKKGKADALAEIDSDATLSTSEKTMLKGIIEQEYPGGRTFLNKVLPGGK